MIRATDLYMTRAVELMIKDLRKNRFLVKDILCDVINDPLLKGLYGAKEVEKFNLLLDKEIQVNVEHAIDVAKLPAIAVRVGGGSEDTSRTGDPLSDGYAREEVNVNSLDGIMQNPRVILGPLTPESYDYQSGKMIFPDNVSLAGIFEDMLIFDEIEKKSYPITVVLDNSTLYIEPGSRPNLTRMTIRPKSDKALNVRKHYFSSEQVTFICAAVDPVEVIYLYQLMMYMIGRFRLDFFETKNFRTATTTYSPIYKLVEDPNMIFARDITLNGTVEHSYIESTSRPMDGTSPNVRIADAPQTPAVFAQEVSGQGWQPENDD